MADVYAEVAHHFQGPGSVTVNTGRGAQGIKIAVKGKEKMIIMFSKGDLLVQFSPERTAELISLKVGLAYDPGTKTDERSRLVPGKEQGYWITYREESIGYFRAL
jgi:hypothetical protein